MADNNPYIDAALKQLEGNTSFFVTMFESVWGGFIKIVKPILTIAWQFWQDKNEAVLYESWAGMLDMYKDADLISQTVRDSLYEMRNLAFPFNIGMFVGQMLMLSANYLMAVNAPAQALIVQKINQDQRPSLPQYRDVLQAAFIAPEKTGAVRDIMARNGFKEEDIDLLFLANYRLYDMTIVQILFLRGILTKDQMFERMRELGFTDTRTKEIIQTWEVLPSPQDLLFMVAKEAFEPDIIEMIGLGDEFPQEQVAFLQKQGISEFWAKKYWAAHWDQPSVGQGYEMLHRGEINKDELEILFKAVEMPPFWREKLTAIAYTPYSRVDVRRMQDMNVLDTEAVFKAYTDIGYDTTKAGKMTEFTLKYNAQNNKELTKTQLINSYIDGLITRIDAKEMLIAIDYPDDLAEYNLVLAEFKRDLDDQDDITKNIGERFMNNLILESEVRQKLGSMNLPATRIEILIDKWKIKLFKDIKIPSKTDMIKFFLGNLITETDLQLELQRLGYSYFYAGLYVSEAKVKKGA